MTILAIHRQAPNWPADPQRPIVQVEHAGSTYWVETNGPAPNAGEIQAVLFPPVVPLDARARLERLFEREGLTIAEARAVLNEPPGLN